MTEREAYIAFNLLPDVGAVKVGRLREKHGDAVSAWDAVGDRLDWQGKPPQWEREIERAEKMKVKLVTLIDDDYPPLLKEIASPPLVLYVAGEVAALDRPAVALVGTRHPTLYGQETAHHFAIGLAHAQWAVYSGLALGIDAAAHRGALEGGGVTAAILGGALDKFYPKDNTRLAREIVDAGGAVASEFPFGRQPDQQTFPQRNRIVAGLSRGVVAVEAPMQSGTLITCRLAGEQGRTVMAVPGRIDSKNSQGCLHLIREGATMVASVDDILEAVGGWTTPRPKPAVDRAPPIRRSPVSRTPPAARNRPEVVEASMSVEEAAVLSALNEEPMSVDELVRKTHLPVGRLNSLLAQLRMKRRINFLPSNRVQRVGG